MVHFEKSAIKGLPANKSLNPRHSQEDSAEKYIEGIGSDIK